ncbi:hypothetical protein JKF63_07561 [Porcisia hertigi]|uniref:Conserved oligomeric Golgi complex subunit 1 n=1 Tax=Porcisia hertigi TaxID=2761500 RepID=A0A836LM74_9TRYP|nr:hypothetical protein JKF63_07561 [Porcisia hertigi]
MSLEEAAQEVRRILRHNNVEETVRYLSSVTRSIEANQHDLRVIMGKSYQDLLVACDGVVGMQRDCDDILTIERAMERAGVSRETLESGDAKADVEPLLPPSWFAARLRRQRRASSAAARTTASSGTNTNTARETPSGATARNGYPAATDRSRSDSNRGASVTLAAQEGLGASVRTTGLNPAFLLPIVTPPFSSALPTHANTMGAPSIILMESETSSARLAAQRMRLDDELNALHLDYVTLASAAYSMPRDTEAVMAKLSSDCANANTPASLSLGANLDRHLHTHHDSPHADSLLCSSTALSVAAQEKQESFLCSLEGDLPLLRFARRLHRVQASLRVYGPDEGGAETSTSVSCAAGTYPNRGSRRARRPLSWVTGFQRRATTLEVRLVKLMLRFLRRAADEYARIQEQQDRLAGQTSTAGPKADSHRSSAEAKVKAGRAAEHRHLVRVWLIFVQCHSALRALGDSPTLVDALVACAPGVALSARPSNSSEIQDKRPEALTRAITSLDGAADVLFWLASQNVRAVLSHILEEAALPTSAHVDSSTGTGVLSGAANPCRMLLALLAVLLLRESQVSAVRWDALASSCSPTVFLSHEVDRQTAASDSLQQPSALLSGSLESQSMTATAGRSSTRAKPEGNVSSFFPTGLLPETRVFATTTHLSALGLGAKTIDRLKTSTGVSEAKGSGLSNTTWALRCFSGLSFLLRAFADYVDLLQATSAEVPPAVAALDEEMSLLYLLQRTCMSDGATSDEQLWDTDHSADVAAHARQDNGHQSFTTSAGAVGVRSLGELLDWRLRNLGRGVTPGGVADDCPGTPFVFRLAGDSRLLSPLSSAGGAQTTPMGESGGVVPVPVTSGVEPSPSASVAARRRAYVELLRASVNNVAELQTGSALSTALGNGSLTAASDDGVRRRTPAACKAIDLESPLKFVCERLLAPCVSSLVLLLARDPLALGVYSKGRCNHDTAAAPQAVRAALQRLLPEGFRRTSLSGTTDPAEGVSNFSGLGQTCRCFDMARWWESTEQTTLCAALQRCVTVALETVSFVESCVARGLAASAHRMLQTSGGGSDAELQHPAGGGNTHRDASCVSAVGHTWSALFSVLRLHALSTLGSASSAGGRGSGADPKPPGAREREQGVAHSCIRGSASVPLTRQSAHRDGRNSLSSRIAGINWDRFRPRTATLAVDSAHLSCRTTFGESIFCEDGLEWGRAACRAAQLPLSGISEATCAKGDGQLSMRGAALVSSELNASQQAQLAQILSGVQDILFPEWELSCAVEHEATADSSSSSSSASLGALHLNGHAAEVLHRCLVTLVEAVHAQTAGALTLPDDKDSSLAPSMPPPLHMRIVGWLRDALQRVSLPLCDAPTGFAPNAETAGVVYGYEVSLLVRVYSQVLQRLQFLVPPGEATVVSELCADAEQLYERMQAPWQNMLIDYYRTSLKQAYSPLSRLRESADKDLTSATAASRVEAALRRMTHSNSAAWVRAPIAAQVAPQDSHAKPSHGVAYPMQPTPALMTVTQATLRHLHQALYGTPRLFCSSPTPLGSPAPGAGDTRSVPALSGKGQGHGGATSATASADIGDARRCGMHVLVAEKEQQRLRERLAATAAELYELELCPLIDWIGGGSGGGVAEAHVHALPTGRTVLTAAASTQCDADDVRLQWYMDVLFTSSVWCAGRESIGGCTSSSSSTSITGADSVVNALFASDGCSGGVSTEAAACVVEDGPLRHVVRHLQSRCDSVRWRSAAPLIIAGYRDFISASGLLWVACSERPHNGGAGATHKGAALRGLSVAAAAAARPLVPTGTVVAAPCSTERLLIPRDGLERLTLLPIAMSSSADLTSGPTGGARALPVSGSVSTAPHVPETHSFVPPMAAALNPNLPSSSSLTTRPYRIGGPSSAVVASAAGFRSSVGAADVIGVDGAAIAAGSNSTAVSSAASALWGTTQRGWSQLWGTG